MSFEVRRLCQEDVPLLVELLHVFGSAFNELETYTDEIPSDAYSRSLLGERSFIALVALHQGRVVGGLAAYELKKFERERSEIYVYDLAVESSCRRRGIATALIEGVREVALECGAHAVFVQADTGEEDAAAIALYSKLGTREEVLHFDIPLGTDRLLR